MLTCALIVWILQPVNFDYTEVRETFLTEQECISNLSNNYSCIKKDKRYDLTKTEWQKDNCSISEHEWVGEK